ncbi:hypothetical protein GALMADRAFT_146483 [Galerina marginata CBS 339.88]|uniref:Uncharacterized protein n=1 Tax=Galerina marginata (strain CBS 339.88) TaxID=685588 RepID=A0A067SBE5_GALM3|nr:hypothetical protein GALMADRAFT_146483 [Galerina marginata CBS 339.88]
MKSKLTAVCRSADRAGTTSLILHIQTTYIPNRLLKGPNLLLRVVGFLLPHPRSLCAFDLLERPPRENLRHSRLGVGLVVWRNGRDGWARWVARVGPDAVGTLLVLPAGGRFSKRSCFSNLNPLPAFPLLACVPAEAFSACSRVIDGTVERGGQLGLMLQARCWYCQCGGRVLEPDRGGRVDGASVAAQTNAQS